jgi:hypothetical protein
MEGGEIFNPKSTLLSILDSLELHYAEYMVKKAVKVVKIKRLFEQSIIQ